MAITQDEQPMAVTTPLGKDKLLLDHFSAMEQLSGLYQYKLQLLAQPDFDVEFQKVLGEEVGVRIDFPESFSEKARYYHGMVCHLRESKQERSASEGAYYIRYEATVVPKLWLLTKNKQSRIFQQKKIPDILSEVLKAHNISFKLELQATYEPLNYCVQYRETDFDFISRLMEEEGIFYFFKHEEKKHAMILADSDASHVDVPGGAKASEVNYWDADDEGFADTNVVYGWEKSQEIRSGKSTVWDHHFQDPPKNYEATEMRLSSTKAGKAPHKLDVAKNSKLEVYDYPARIGQRFDEIDSGGAEQSAELAKLSKDNTRLIKVRMQEETISAIIIKGKSQCHQFCPGHKFKLINHFHKADGEYVLSTMSFIASMKGIYTTNVSQSLSYENSFQCFPSDLPYRPESITPKPHVEGTQTAVVVGPKGQEIFTDKYGRVKVQFHWDREGKKDAKSSCWIRVATTWAGKSWGALNVPRIGQEVVIAFLEGDPDRPIIIGSVYNAEQMPPYVVDGKKLVEATHSGIKTRSTMKGKEDNYNEIRLEDLKGEELFYLHAEKDFIRVVEDRDIQLISSKDSKVDGKAGSKLLKKTELGSQTIQIHKHRTETVMEGDETVTIKKGKRSIYVDTADDYHQIKKGHREILIDTGNSKLTITKGDRDIKLSAGSSTTDVAKAILLKVGGSSIKIEPAAITIKSPQITIQADATAKVSSPATTVSGDGTLTLNGGMISIN